MLSKKRTEPLNLRTEGTTKKLLIKIAERDGVSVSDVVNKFFADYLTADYSVWSTEIKRKHKKDGRQEVVKEPKKAVSKKQSRKEHLQGFIDYSE